MLDKMSEVKWTYPQYSSLETGQRSWSAPSGVCGNDVLTCNRKVWQECREDGGGELTGQGTS